MGLCGKRAGLFPPRATSAHTACPGPLRPSQHGGPDDKDRPSLGDLASAPTVSCSLMALLSAFFLLLSGRFGRSASRLPGHPRAVAPPAFASAPHGATAASGARSAGRTQRRRCHPNLAEVIRSPQQHFSGPVLTSAGRPSPDEGTAPRGPSTDLAPPPPNSDDLAPTFPRAAPVLRPASTPPPDLLRCYESPEPGCPAAARADWRQHGVCSSPSAWSVRRPAGAVVRSRRSLGRPAG